MKKTLLIILTALLIFTTACSSGGRTIAYPIDDTYHQETDDPLYNTSNLWGGDILRVENGYYFLFEDTLLYADDDAMKPIPVCTRPNCLHSMEPDREKLDEVRETCEAYFNQGKLMYSNGQLYILYRSGFVDNTLIPVCSLAQVSADGSRRRDILKLQGEFPTRCCIHRGRLYVSTEGFEQEATTSAQLWSYSLDNPHEEPVLLYKTEEREMMGNPISLLRAYGNRLYVRELLRNLDDTRGPRYALHIYNLTTGEWSELEMPEDHNLGSHFIHDGKLWCTYTPIDPTNQYKKGEERPESSVILYVYELDGSGGTRVAHDDLGSMNADESYIYMTSPVSYEAPASGQAVSSLPTRSLFFYDSQMNLIDEMSFDAFNQEEGELIIFNMFPLWGGKTLMLADYRNVNTYWYIDHAEVGTGNITPVEFLRYEGGDYSFTDNGGPRG